MSERVFVTGLGVISAIGQNVPENLASLLALRTGLGPLSTIVTRNQALFPFCEIQATNDQLAQWAGLAEPCPVSRTALLGVIAAQEACLSAGLQPEQLKKTAFISANTVGGMDRSEVFFADFLQNPQKGKLKDVVGHPCGYSTQFIAEKLGVKGFQTTINTACSSSANAIMFGARLIKNRKTPRVIVGGTDALTRFTINGFSALKILDPEGCKPFSRQRAGLNLGEGAAYLVLESESTALKHKQEPICELTGYANTCDAYHQTASSPDGDGSFAAMEQALRLANVSVADVDYINAHGTGTLNNDLAEGRAIERLFRESVPPVSSTKPYTGHTLGAAGSIEAVFSCLALRDGVIFPNLRWGDPMEELSFTPTTKLLQHQTLRHVVSNSFGFGGNDTALLFSSC